MDRLILRRIGSKQKIRHQIIKHFRPNIFSFIDLFMGTGAITFEMAERGTPYIFANDKDEDIFNLFQVLRFQKEALLEAIGAAPLHESLFKYWLKTDETDTVWKAARFLYLSNYSYLGAAHTFHISNSNFKQTLLKMIKTWADKILSFNVKFICADFRDVLKKIERPNRRSGHVFLYADPPYLETGNNYAHDFTLQDMTDLFDVCKSSGFHFAISAFKNDKITALAEGLHLTEILTHRTLKNRNTEILVTNYQPLIQQNLFI